MKTHPGTNIPIDRKNNEQNARHFEQFQSPGDPCIPNKAQHSPLPWSADKWATGYTISARDHSVCRLQDCNNEEANAALIVRAVNHADKLAEALLDLRTRIVATGPNCLNTTKADEVLAAYEESK